MTQQHAITYTVLAQGDSDWLRTVAAPLAQEIESAVPKYEGELPVALLEQGMFRGTTNGLFGCVCVAVIVFVAKKVGDDFYDVLFKPRIRKCFETLEKKLRAPNRRAKKVLVLNFWYGQHNVVVSIWVTFEDFVEIMSQLEMIGEVHSNALSWIAKHGVLAPVHQYRIENRQVNSEPLLLDNIDWPSLE